MLGLFRKKQIVNKDPIGAALIKPQVIEGVDQQYILDLQKGTAAERAYGNTLAVKWAAQSKVQWALERSREIDLHSLLKMRGPKGSLVWAFVNPNYDIKHSFAHGGGSYHIPNMRGDYLPENDIHTRKSVLNLKPDDKVIPQSFPILPQRIREMIKSPDVTQHANVMGILYKTDEWAIEKAPVKDPDPALIVKWNGIPNKFFCLAIWGGDRPQIEEFLK